jgi:uncharacterized protein YndB with AHSA1/START domain
MSETTKKTIAGKPGKTGDFTGHEFVLTRTFDAPRDLVFKAWTEPQHLARWWGPKGFTNPLCEWDAQAGGKIFDVMRGPDGTEYPMGGEFREIDPPGRLVFMCGPLDEKGKFIFEFLHTATFAERAGKTEMTLHSKVLRATPGADRYIRGFEMGMSLSLDRLTELLGQKGEPVIVERVFDAPAGLVWQALTDANKIRQWSFEMEEFKPEVGFEFEFVAGKEDVKYKHLCKITDVIPEKKLAYTWRYEGYEGDSLVTIELYADGPKTRLRLTHEGLETFTVFARANFLQGWTTLVGTMLKNFVENKTADREIVMTRVVSAPRELVWDAMTDPKHLVNWWGPRGFSTTVEKMDFRVGGEWKQVMHGPDGANYPNQHIFEEIVKPERIVYSHGGRREGGSSVSSVATWTFEPAGEGKTRVTIRMVFPSAPERDRVVKEFGAVEGGRQTLERLDEYLADKIKN